VLLGLQTSASRICGIRQAADLARRLAFMKSLFRGGRFRLVFLCAVEVWIAAPSPRQAGHRLTMAIEFGSHDWPERMVREWLLLLLRFAVTLEPSDRSAALAMADQLDSLGMQWRPAAPRFFQRTSEEVCQAILMAGARHNNLVLQRHIARIGDPRLRRAFQAAVGLRPMFEQRQRSARRWKRKKQDLWKGPAK
jgi:hypothetical protein